jgi:hypothetical protein
MGLNVVKLNYRIIHQFDEIPLSDEYKGFDFKIFNKGLYIIGEKMYQSKKMENQFIIDVFQNESVNNLSEYFDNIYSSRNNLKMLIIEEL